MDVMVAFVLFVMRPGHQTEMLEQVMPLHRCVATVAHTLLDLGPDLSAKGYTVQVSCMTIEPPSPPI